jgi:hypothetical protein
MKRMLPLLACALVVSLTAPAQTKDRKASDLPFSAFRALDQRFTDLQDQFHALEASLQADEKELARTRAWVAPGKRLRGDIRSVEKTAHRLRLYYRHSDWGRRAFLALEAKAKRMGRQTDALVRARAVPAAKEARDALSREMLPLIVQFQALTANYGALHCDAGQTACCEPKKRDSSEQGPEHECRWVCVENKKTCRAGVTGPKTE